jgi:hypothetical protein
MVQGLVTTTSATKIAGDLNLITREMTFEFLRPVSTDETTATDVMFTKLEEQDGRLWACVEAVWHQRGRQAGFAGTTSGLRVEPP